MESPVQTKGASIKSPRELEAMRRAGQVVDQNEWSLVYATRKITEFNLYRRGGNNLAPLYLFPDADGPSLPGKRVPNLSHGFLKHLGNALSIKQTN